MSGKDPARRPADTAGGATARKGTPAPVSLGVSRQFLVTVSLLLAGPVLWSLHFLVVYLFAEAACTDEGRGIDAGRGPAVVWVTVVATVVGVLACAAAALWAHRRARVGPDRELALVGALLSWLGVVSVLFVGVPALVVSACGP